MLVRFICWPSAQCGTIEYEYVGHPSDLQWVSRCVSIRFWRVYTDISIIFIHNHTLDIYVCIYIYRDYMQYYTATAHLCPPQQCVHAEGFLWWRARSGFVQGSRSGLRVMSTPAQSFLVRCSTAKARTNLRATMRYLTHIWRSTFTCAPCPFLGLCAICPARETSKTF